MPRLRAYALPVILVLALTAATPANAQEAAPGPAADTLSGALYDAFAAVAADTVEASRRLLEARADSLLGAALAAPGGFDIDLDTLSGMLSCLTSEDGRCRLITWSVALPDGTRAYRGYAQHRPPKGETTTTRLRDTKQSRGADAVYRGGEWFGCVYYEIIPARVDKNLTVYTLLGRDDHSLRAVRKVVEPLWFDKGRPVFGKKVFELPKGNPNRLVFNVNSRAVMPLWWSRDDRMILFGHLVPIPNMPSTVEGGMAPDDSLDGLRWTNDRWKQHRDVTPAHPRKPRKTMGYPY